jgi:hypothetical protein
MHWLSMSAALLGVTIAFLTGVERASKVALVVGSAVGLVAIWLPPAISSLLIAPLAACSIILIGAAFNQQSRRERAHDLSLKTAAIASALMAIGIAGGGRAEGNPIEVVYIVPKSGSEANDETVLVSPSLFERLTAIAAGDHLSQRAAVVSARYVGKVEGATATFDVEFDVLSLAESTNELMLPLTGVSLGQATLDDAPAFPRQVDDRLVFSVKGLGRHSLKLSFAVACPKGSEREVLFRIPNIAMSSMTFRAPRGATHLREVSGRGSQRYTVSDDGPVISSDLGRSNTLRIRWSAGEAGQSAALQVSEAHVWDFREPAPLLTSCFRITPNRETTSVSFAIPAEIEVVAVHARPINAANDRESTPWIRDWHVRLDGLSPRLQIEFSAPILGSWQVLCQCVPRAPFPASFALPFPNIPGALGQRSVYAWRSGEIELAVARTVGVAPMNVAEFQMDDWLPASIEAEPQPPDGAFVRSSASAKPMIRLSMAPRRISSMHSTNWKIGPSRATCEWEGTITASGERLGWIEWDVPAEIAITDVHGEDIATWSRSGRRLQAWLKRPVEETRVRWQGIVQRSSVNDSGGSGRSFEVPFARLLGAVTYGSVQIRGETGWSVQPIAIEQLVELRESGNAGERQYREAGARPRAVVELRAAPESEANESLRPVPTPAPAVAATVSPLRVEVAQVTSAELADGRWIHRYVARVSGKLCDGLNLRWPKPVHVVSLSYGDERLIPLQSPVSQVELPLTADSSKTSETKILVAYWTSIDSEETIHPPIPRMECYGRIIEAESQFWRIESPTGRRPTSERAPIESSQDPAKLLGSRMIGPFSSLLDGAPATTWQIDDAAQFAIRWENAMQPTMSAWLRTAALMALLTLAVLLQSRLGRLAWPEVTVIVALSGWLATGMHFWLVAAVAALLARAVMLIQCDWSRRWFPSPT